MQRFIPLLLLVGSNVFMTFAWYGHLKTMRSRPLVIVILVSWAIAFFEYCLQVPANRLGHAIYTLPQLKVAQEIISMTVFGFFCVFYMEQKISWDFVWAALCLAAAGFFLFRHIG